MAQAEYDAQGTESIGGTAGRVVLLPTVVINNKQYRGRLDTISITKALCAGFDETTEPEVLHRSAQYLFATIGTALRWTCNSLLCMAAEMFDQRCHCRLAIEDVCKGASLVSACVHIVRAKSPSHLVAHAGLPHRQHSRG